MNQNIIITCAVTGAGDTVGKNPHIPVTPRQIADAAIQAALAEVEARMSGRGRVLLRASGTEPLLRVMVEGEDRQQVLACAEELASVVRVAAS